MNIRARMLQRLHVYASGAYVHPRVNDDDLQIQIPEPDCNSEPECIAPAPLAGEIDLRLKAEIRELENKIDALLKRHREMEEGKLHFGKK